MKDLFLFLLIGFLLLGCVNWELLGPNEDIVLLNVRVHFNFGNQEISVENQNWNSARTQLSRQTSGYEYLEIYDGYIRGEDKKIISSSFNHGDKMKLRIRIRNDEGELIDQETYFQLS
jgi:hypothetical protein